VGVTVRDEKGGSQPVTRTVTLRGPGDVVGIEASQIVRRVPTPERAQRRGAVPRARGVRPTELPWLFTPAQPVANRLRPWVALVVVDAAAGTVEPGPAELPSRLRTRLGELPRLDEAWAWAHAQVAGKKAGGLSVATRLGESHAPTNLSRLVCPRRLAPGRHYIAALVPTYDAGVQAGLGLAGGTLGPAWSRAADGSDAEGRCSCRSTTAGASPSARPATSSRWPSESTGCRPVDGGAAHIDASNPRGGLPALGDDDEGRLQMLRCALVSPMPVPQGAPAEGSGWSAEMREVLRARLDAPASAPDAPPCRAWGRASTRGGSAARRRWAGSGDGDWFTQLNTSPVHRIVAGVGTRVVQKDQEQLMQVAWAQVARSRRRTRCSRASSSGAT
jgi:hypothetical protein